MRNDPAEIKVSEYIKSCYDIFRTSKVLGSYFYFTIKLQIAQYDKYRTLQFQSTICYDRNRTILFRVSKEIVIDLDFFFNLVLFNKFLRQSGSVFFEKEWYH